MDITLLRTFSTTRRIKTGTWSQFQPAFLSALSPCMLACPCGTDIPSIYHLFLSGKEREAALRLLEFNPLPMITSRVCPRPCEEECNRGGLDEPVAIREIERFLGDMILEEKIFPEKRGYAQGKAVVVGSGPAGLTASWFLALEGYDVVVYEECREVGGVLYWGIPSFRLDKGVLGEVVRRWQEMGIEFVTGCRITPDSLPPASVVVVATGLTRPRSLPVEGIEHAVFGVELLKRHNLGESFRGVKRALVIGGGNVAVDAARVLARDGADTLVVCVEPEDAMPALAEEVELAMEDGVRFLPSTGVERIEKLGDAFRVHMRRAKVVGQEEGVLKVELFGEGKFVDVDAVVAAFGQVAEFDWGDGVVLCGDALEGPGTVAGAVASARAAVERLLGRKGPALRDREHVVSFEELNLFYFEKSPSNPVGDKEGAIREMKRCFSCGYCNGCGNCWIFCPDVSIELTEEGPKLDAEHCKGCGICESECPRRVVVMKRKF